MSVAVSVGVKRTSIVSAVLLLIPLAGMSSRAQSPSAPAAGEIRKLRILYAGHPGTDREKDFVGFLKQYFDVVRTGNLQTFKEEDTRGFDVTLLDWDWNDLKGPKPTVSESFSRPVVTLGVPGAVICRQWKLKTGYL